MANKENKTEPFFNRTAYMAIFGGLVIAIFVYNLTYFKWICYGHNEVDKAITDLTFEEKVIIVPKIPENWQKQAISGFEFSLPAKTVVKQDELTVWFQNQDFTMHIPKLKRGKKKVGTKSSFLNKLKGFSNLTSRDIKYTDGWGRSSDKIDQLKDKEETFKNASGGYFFEFKNIKGLVTHDKQGVYSCYLFSKDETHWFGVKVKFNTEENDEKAAALAFFLNGITFPEVE